MEDTAKHWKFGQAPARVDLLGDKLQRPESVEHIISFPGGAIEVARTTDGDYWAHIIIYQGSITPQTGMASARGEVVASRVCRAGEMGVAEIEGAERASQIAVRIRTTKPGARA
ncbi:hypothetical protein ACQVP2_07305 [Methylobacterium aquaticum]|uniref:hypothetical protein n=1 Tax=Methylobacterium aquaticum TaxID=270351 RepID=UPI003D17F406